MSILNQEIFTLLQLIAANARINRTQAYLVGGFVRDYLLNRETRDIDIAVDKSPLLIARSVASELKAKYILLDEQNNIFRVIIKNGKRQTYVDISAYSNTIEDDLLRRDFTINSMAVNLQNLEYSLRDIIDPFDGKKDLKKRIVKATNAHVFSDDPSRLLRAVRLAHILNFSIDQETEEDIAHNYNLITSIAVEKIREELLAILNTPNSFYAFSYLDRLNLLTAIIPELADLKGIEQPKEHYWDVFSHSLQTIATLELLLRESKWRYNIGHLLTHTHWTRHVIEHFNKKVSYGSNRKQLLKLAGLLHDIAKPATKTTDENGRIRFIGHTSQGAAMTSKILQRLRFSKKEINTVNILIQHHLRPIQLSDQYLPTKRAIYRFFRDTEGYGIDVLFLALADYLAARGANIELEDWKAVNKLSKYIVDEHQKTEEKSEATRLLSGNDLMYILKIEPGPLVGKLLSIIDEAFAAGEINTREEAIKLANKKLKQHTLEE